MSKELEALKRIKSHYNDRVCIDILEDFDIIETALKNDDKEKFDLIQQVRELKDEVASLKSFNSKLLIEREDNQKKLKALEIIKENFVPYDIEVLKNDKVRIWVGRDNYFDVDKDKYDLLKEVLL